MVVFKRTNYLSILIELALFLFYLFFNFYFSLSRQGLVIKVLVLDPRVRFLLQVLLHKA